MMDFVYLLSLVPSLTEDIIKFHLFTHVSLRLRRGDVSASSGEKTSARRAQIKFGKCFVSQFIIDQIYIKISSAPSSRFIPIDSDVYMNLTMSCQSD